MEASFTKIYDKNIWGSGSGTGSKMSRNNVKYIDMVQDVLKEYPIKTICDVGCGDWVFSQHIDFGERKYLGIDCVKSVTDSNKKMFKKKNIKFDHKVIGDDYIPEGYDLIIIKDVIQHWTDADIIKYFTQILDKNKYVFCTNGYKFMRDQTKNSVKVRDITNQYRYWPVDIDKTPLVEFKEHCINTQTYHAKQMNLFCKDK
jgi:cyclopropane fatty-acyl-phospholipid synthase-like methyltransferase